MRAVRLTPSHVYASPGTYTATLTATDSAGHTGSSNVAVTVKGTGPTVSSHTPAATATGVAVSSAPTATFNEAVQAGTITFTLATGAGTAVSGTTSYNAAANTETFTSRPTAALAYGTTYTARVSGAKDTAGDPMAGPLTWSFTTATALVPTVDRRDPGIERHRRGDQFRADGHVQ